MCTDRRFRPSLVGLMMAACALSAVPPVLAQTGEPVDVELVLAVDVSWSMAPEEQQIQRDGYAEAFRSQEVIDTIRTGGYGKVAVTYVEWAGDFSQTVLVPWTIIEDEASAHAFADLLVSETPRSMRRTSISGAIDFSAKLFDDNGYEGVRRIIDISGDGPNNQGRPVTEARDDAVARGITINGLPLMTSGGYGGYSIKNLDDYYANCVIGGGLAFVVPVTEWSAFPEAVRRKLVLELAGKAQPEVFASGLEWDSEPLLRLDDEPEAGRGATAHAVSYAGPGQPPYSAFVQTVQLQPRPGGREREFDCMLGEQMWNQRQWIWDNN